MVGDPFELGPEGALHGGEVVRILLRDRRGELLGPRPERAGVGDDLGDDAERAGPAGVDALARADERHARDRLHRRLLRQRDRLVRAHLPDAHVGIEERGLGRGDHDVGVGHEVQATAGAHAVDRGDHGLRHAVVPRGEPQRRRRACGATARAGRPCRVRAGGRRARSGTPRRSRCSRSRARRDRASSSCHAVSSSASIVASIAFAASGRSNTSQPTGTVAPDLERLVGHDDRSRTQRRPDGSCRPRCAGSRRPGGTPPAPCTARGARGTARSSSASATVPSVTT